ncbi:MAG: hypothetical protein ACTHK2_04470 [Dokdonella sp.]|uniref:hypothetical protein n=1 Tax=Dokdonella sp. TaxID=2291710 RepID=UPI003F7D1C54
MGAGQRFEVQVVALDKFTKTFRNLNDQASRAARPLVNTHRQVAMLAKEMHLDTMAKGMGKVSSAALTMTRTIGLSLGPLESALGLAGGVGIVGALGAAAVGVAKLGVNFAASGFEIVRTSQAVGVSTKFLQRMRGAAKLAGVEVGAVDDTIRGLGDTLQNARFGRDPTAYAVLNRLGIGIPMKNGQVDQEAALEGVERALARISDPHVRDALADALHIPREALPLLLQGADAVKALGDRAEKLGLEQGPDSLKWSVDFTNSLNRMKAAIEGVGNQIGASLGPAATSTFDRFAKVLEDSKKDRLGSALKGAGSFAFLWPNLVADWFSGSNRTSAQSVGGAIGGRLHAGAYVPGEAASSVPGAGAVVPRNNPGNLRSWPGMPSAGGFAQFPSPQAGLQAMAAQLGLYGARGNDTVAGIVGQWAPPSDHNDTAAYIADVVKRTGFAPGQHLNLGDPAVLSPLMAAMVNHEQGRQPFSGQQYADAAAGAQKVAIDVHVHGLPPGATVTAQQRLASADAFTPTRIGYSMPAGSMP